MRAHLQRVREQAIGKWIIDQKTGNGEEMWLVRPFTAVALQCAKIIGVTEFTPQLFEEAPITLCPFAPDLLFQMTLEVRRNAIVIQQRVVDIEQKHDSGWSPGFWSLPLHWVNGRTAL